MTLITAPQRRLLQSERDSALWVAFERSESQETELPGEMEINGR